MREKDLLADPDVDPIDDRDLQKRFESTRSEFITRAVAAYNGYGKDSDAVGVFAVTVFVADTLYDVGGTAVEAAIANMNDVLDCSAYMPDISVSRGFVARLKAKRRAAQVVKRLCKIVDAALGTVEICTRVISVPRGYRPTTRKQRIEIAKRAGMETIETAALTASGKGENND